MRGHLDSQFLSSTASLNLPIAVGGGSGDDPPLADNVLEGAAAISTFIFGSPDKRRKVYYLARTSRLPIFRYGSRLCARKSKLLEWIRQQEDRFDPKKR